MAAAGSVCSFDRCLAVHMIRQLSRLIVMFRVCHIQGAVNAVLSTTGVGASTVGM